MAEQNPYAVLYKDAKSNPYAALAGETEEEVLPIDEFMEIQKLAEQEAATEQEYAKYQNPREYEDAATPADLRKLSTSAVAGTFPFGMDPPIPVGEAGEFGITAATKMGGMPIDKSVAAMAGAMAGEAAGFKLGGKQGIAPGGVLGSGISSLSFDTLDGMFRFLQGDPEQDLTPDLARAGKQVVGAGETMTDEMVAQSGGRILTKLFGGAKNMWSRTLGTNDPQAAELASLAAQFRVPLGIVQAVPSDKWVKGFTRVLGVLPYVSTPFKESSQKVTEALGRNMHEFMDAFSPNVNASSTVSGDIVDRADEAFRLFNVRSDQLYQRFFDMAKQLPENMQAFIPTSNLGKAAQTVIDQFDAGRVGPKELRKSPIVDWARNVQAELTFSKKLTPEKFKAQMEDLHRAMREENELITTANPKEKRSLGPGNIIKMAMEKDLSAPELNFVGSFKNGEKLEAGALIDPETGLRDPNAVTGPMIAKALQRADTFFSKQMDRFKNATVGKFRSVDPGVFKASFKEAGTREKDQLFRQLFTMDSVVGIQQLQKLVGKSRVLNGLRTVVDQAMEKAGESLLQDLPGPKALANVKKALGIGSKNGELVLDQALKGSNVTVDSIKKLFKLIDANDSVFNPQTSTFLQRRLTLGGPAAFTGLAGAGGYMAGDKEGALGGVAGAVAGIVLLRKGARYLTNPKNLRTMTQALDDSLGPRVRRNAYARLLRDAVNDPENQNLPTMDELETSAEQLGSTIAGVSQNAPEQRMIQSISRGLTPAAMQKIKDISM